MRYTIFRFKLEAVRWEESFIGLHHELYCTVLGWQKFKTMVRTYVRYFSTVNVIIEYSTKHLLTLFVVIWCLPSRH